MCLAIPGRIVKVDGSSAVVDYAVKQVLANNSLVNAKIGDYVIVSAKFVVQTVPEKEALEALKTWKGLI